jgi:hypothetical protein
VIHKPCEPLHRHEAPRTQPLALCVLVCDSVAGTAPMWWPHVVLRKERLKEECEATTTAIVNQYSLTNSLTHSLTHTCIHAHTGIQEQKQERFNKTYIYTHTHTHTHCIPASRGAWPQLHPSATQKRVRFSYCAHMYQSQIGSPERRPGSMNGYEDTVLPAIVVPPISFTTN